MILFLKISKIDTLQRRAMGQSVTSNYESVVMSSNLAEALIIFTVQNFFETNFFGVIL